METTTVTEEEEDRRGLGFYFDAPIQEHLCHL